MKKIMKAIFATSIIICSSSSSVINALPKARAISEATMLGQQLIKEVDENIKKTNEAFKAAASGPAREEAAKSARDAAQNLIDALNDIKTFGTDIIRGYNPKQIQIAAITLTELLTRLHRTKLEIKSKRMEIIEMTSVGIFFDTVISGKEAQRNQAIKEQQNNHKEKSDIEKAMAAQKEILGTTWNNIITSATYDLLIGNSLGICYEIDWSFGAHNTKILENSQISNRQMTTAAPSRHKLTKEQHAAIKSWHRLSKSELLSKELSSTEEVIQANNLLKQLQNIQDDLKNVPTVARYKNIVHEVTKAINSLSQKIDATKTRWLKIV